ncbi:MAG: hypothetical protein ACTSQV_09170 [Alphaproteobacteria bacterium]
MSLTTTRHRADRPGLTLSTGIAAGLAGGAAEVAWIALYGSFSGVDAAAVASGVTVTLFPALAAHPAAVALGIALHMAIAVLLGAAIAVALRAGVPRLAGTIAEPLAVIGLLVAIWAMNFLVILPQINPGFVELVPLGVALTSKVLFGTAAAMVLFRRDRRAA